MKSVHTVGDIENCFDVLVVSSLVADAARRRIVRSTLQRAGRREFLKREVLPF